MFVLVENGKAKEFFNSKPVFHPELMDKIIEYSGEVKHGYTWDGAAFKPEFTAEQIAAKKAAAEQDAAAEELKQIDLDSIRAIREYIASKPDAPQILKDRETAAAAARLKLA